MQDTIIHLFKITNHEIKISQFDIQSLIIIFNPNVNQSSGRSQLDKNTVSVFITENIMFIPLIKSFNKSNKMSVCVNQRILLTTIPI